MIFLANRASLDTRTLLTRLHNKLQTQVTDEISPIERVWYHTSKGNKASVRATINPDVFLGTSYPADEAALQISFDFPTESSYDYYSLQWVESEHELRLGWHQDETHMDLGECHFQIDYQGETVPRERAAFLDIHQLNVFDH
ncbi:hypothetical protein [Halovenus marina]|uniref:hypothetical protein n=1 Tax=Halovenus marina TaxID=3396621 RepID=UPI003F55D528